jgi:Ca2+-binding EF-hand superfamily protein
MRDIFVFSDVDGSGYISANELQLLLKNCGCPPSTNLQKISLETCIARCQVKDMEQRGYDNPETKLTEDVQFDFPDIVELVAEYNHVCIKSALENHYSKTGYTFCVEQSELPLIYYKLGQFKSRKAIDQLLLDLGLDIKTAGEHLELEVAVFEKSLANLRIQAMQEWRRTFDFQDCQLVRFQSAFEAQSNQVKVVTLDLLPRTVRGLGYDIDSADSNALFKRFIATLPNDSDDVSWDLCLLLVNQLDNQKQLKTLKKEEEVAKQIGLDKESVHLLRECFKGWDSEAAGEISKHTTRLLLSTMGVAKSQQSRRALTKQLIHIRGDKVDFGTFLWLLNKLDGTANLG